MSAACLCIPCTSPAWGAPGVAHCAACCMGTGIEEYDLNCPVDDHSQWARRQQRLDVEEQTEEHNAFMRADAHRSLTSDTKAVWPEKPSPAEVAEDDAEWRRMQREARG